MRLFDLENLAPGITIYLAFLREKVRQLGEMPSIDYRTRFLGWKKDRVREMHTLLEEQNILLGGELNHSRICLLLREVGLIVGEEEGLLKELPARRCPFASGRPEPEVFQRMRSRAIAGLVKRKIGSLPCGRLLSDASGSVLREAKWNDKMMDIHGECSTVVEQMSEYTSPTLGGSVKSVLSVLEAKTNNSNDNDPDNEVKSKDTNKNYKPSILQSEESMEVTARAGVSMCRRRALSSFERVSIFTQSIPSSPKEEVSKVIVEDAKEKMWKLAALNSWQREIPFTYNLSKRETETYYLGLLYQEMRKKKIRRNRKYFVFPLKKDPRKSRNWDAFEKILEVIEDYEFDPVDHITAQFEELEDNGEYRYFPFPNMFHSVSSPERTYAWLQKEIEMNYETQPRKILEAEADYAEKEVGVGERAVQDLIERFPFLSSEMDVYLKYPFFRKYLPEAYLEQSSVYQFVVESGDLETEDLLYAEWQRHSESLKPLRPESRSPTVTISKEKERSSPNPRQLV